MSSLLQSMLTRLQQNDYVTHRFILSWAIKFTSLPIAVAILTAVGYDYVLTFSNEIEYIWTKPWTWVSMLFILVHYVGLYTLHESMVIDKYQVLNLDGSSVFLSLEAASYLALPRYFLTNADD
ncbi:hypothetical protein OG21DRAFT_1490564 [Imleria badia]|nr:hypothetical protein OG21DRAFT_1490564 [Imleria badia]